MQYLKQSTAVTLKIGPFVDDGDGNTAETGLTIARADVRLSKNGGDIAQKTEATSCTHDELGIYGCPIDATDTATLGRLQLWVHESGALPVWHEYMVIPANVYDSLFSTDKLEVDLIQIGGATQSATDLKDFADAGYDPDTNKLAGLDASFNTLITDVGAIATKTQQDTSFNTVITDIGTLPTKTQQDTSFNAVIEDTAEIVNLPTKMQQDTSFNTVIADTNELQTDWGDGGRLDLLLDAKPTKTEQDTSFNTVITEIDANETKIDAIATKTEQDISFNTVIVKTNNIPANPATEAKQDTIISDVGDIATKDQQDTSFNTVITNINALPMKTEQDTSFNTVITNVGAIATKTEADASFNQIADNVWDEILTGATHNIATSAGRRLRQIGAYNITDGTAQAGTAYSITLAAGESSTDHIFNRNLITILVGTGAGQTRTIVDYNGTTKVAVIDRDWWVTPNDTSEYFILADDTPLVVDHGVAQDGGDNTITIRDSASAISDTYIGGIVMIIAGTGAGQSQLIDGYNGTTKVITTCKAWTTNPDVTSVYVIIPYGASSVECISDGVLAQIADKIWDELQSGHIDAGSFGKYLDTEVSGVSGIGSGALSCTWTQKDEGGVPMDNVKVWVCTDEAGSNVIAGTLLTNANGEVSFMLDAGTYYVFRERASYNFTNPQEWSVS